MKDLENLQNISEPVESLDVDDRVRNAESADAPAESSDAQSSAEQPADPVAEPESAPDPAPSGSTLPSCPVFLANLRQSFWD